MNLYFASAEQPQYLSMLLELGVTRVAVSYYEWERRHADINGVRPLRKVIPPGIEITVMPGIAKKENLDYVAFARSYVEFCEHNAEEALFYDLDAAECPPALLKETRKHLAFLPGVVVFPSKDETHLDLAGEYERIGVNANTAKSIQPTELRRLPATLYGSNITDPKVLGPARFEATTSMAWLSARRYGELWFFHRGRLRHFVADQVPRAVRSYSDELVALGGDPEAILGNDDKKAKAALTAVGVRSLQMMAEGLSGRLRDRSKAMATAATAPGASVIPVVPRGTQGAAMEPATATERPRVLLPVLQGDQGAEAQRASQRACDSCDLSDVCPQYKPSSACAFDIPVEIKTDDDWEAACQTILEWQFGRVAHGVFAEQINGGTLTTRVGQEMDRFTKLLAQLKELKRIEQPGAGVLSRLLGDIPALENHGHQEDEVADAEIIEGEDAEEYVDVGDAGWEADAPEQD